ncbi:MAG: hypothetical protein QNK11_08860, partial [Legionella sp.]|nr:hypothetical protein [Legionella sp.]
MPNPMTLDESIRDLKIATSEGSRISQVLPPLIKRKTELHAKKAVTEEEKYECARLESQINIIETLKRNLTEDMLPKLEQLARTDNGEKKLADLDTTDKQEILKLMKACFSSDYIYN